MRPIFNQSQFYIGGVSCIELPSHGKGIPSSIKGSPHWLEGRYLLHAVCVCSIMKLFTLLPMLVLALLQGTLATHLETCQCDQVRQLVNSTVQEAVTGLENRLSLLIHSAVNKINTTDNSALENLENRLTDTMERLLTPIQQQLDYHLPQPRQQENSPDHPATSCQDAFEKYRNAPSGYYWISRSGSASPVRVYCSMSLTCGNQTGVWMRVANIDMRNNSHTCPSGLSLISSPKRLCDITSSGCVSNSFSVQDVQYSHVCGKIIGYQNRIPYAFRYFSRGFNRDCVYGVSLTHGQSPRKHIWTFAGAPDETTVDSYSHKCPCINPALDPRVSFLIPSFVGNDYFCDTALSVYYITVPRALQPSDPPWDGKGCGPTSTCCSFNTPPWFVKDLLSPTTDDVEMRVCRPAGEGSTPIEIVELYVQ